MLGLRTFEPVRAYLNGIDLGELTVFCFFFLSGFLILKSGLRWNSPGHYLASRGLRIFPALVLAVLLCVLVLGPMTTSLTPREYFQQPATRAFLTQAWLHHVHLGLPGVFNDGRSFTEIDAPLWTLPAEWTMYVAVLLVCCFLHRRTLLMRDRWQTVFVLLFAVGLTAQMLPLQWAFAWPWMMAFGFGAACYIYRRFIYLHAMLAPVLLVTYGWLMHREIHHIGVFFLPVLGYFLLTVGYHPALHLRVFHRFGDYSYGLYIYAFPVQQLLLHRYPRPLSLFFASYPLSLGVAIVSWHVVESRCLRLKGRLRRQERGEEAREGSR